MATLDFISRASRARTPDWLDRHREDYETHVLGPVQEIAARAKAVLSVRAPGYHFPQKGIARLRRSAAKAAEHGSYFKGWLSYSAAKPRVSRFEHNPNLYFHVDPTDEDAGDRVLVAGGLYMPSSKQLRSIREAIARDASAFERLFATARFKKRFPGGFAKEKASSRPPRGFDPAHPKIDWLKLQAFYVWRPYSKKEFSSPAFADLVVSDWELILELNHLLELALTGRAPSAAAPTKRIANRLSHRIAAVEAPRRPMDF